ncbi:hypothetical protein [Pseudonocardia sp. TRM90224]|uniref:hypothetical protein n=1 Tax=Pseudonocardia sp. TRM90224 TaxID=2812678 RepID=UPI001E31D4F8|nr:hypothetical protein [Pseudonocardia sp. TRM90224]
MSAFRQSRAFPTPEEVFTRAAESLDLACTALSDARDWLDWLGSDWAPGSELTDAQAVARGTVYRAVAVCKAEIGQAMNAISAAADR